MPEFNSTQSDIQIGSRFSKWTILDTGPRVHNRPTWRCRCDCGAEKNIRGYRLTSGKTVQCDQCDNIGRRLPLRAERFGRWTVIGEARSENGRWRWLCRCDCGREKAVSPSHLVAGKSSGCRGCVKIQARTDARDRHWNRIVRSAARRDIPVVIDKDQAYAILEAQGHRCALSGLEISIRRGSRENGVDRWINTASVDRIDSARPYEAGNLQWLRKDVNKMKLDPSQGRFIELCTLVARHHDKT